MLNPHTEVLVTNGACEALYSSLHHLVAEGDEVVFFEPYYTQYVNYAEFAGATVKTAPLRLVDGAWQYDFDALERTITSKTKVMMITNPHNPTGKLFTRGELEKLTAILDKHPQIVVVSDDVYFHLPYDNREHVLFANIGENYKRTITIFSAGKMMNCTGWKVGWMIGPPELIKHVSYVHESCTFNINVPGQVAIAKSLDESLKPYQGYKDYYEYVRGTFQKARDNALALLKRTSNIKFKPSQCESGYFVALDVSGNEDLIPDRYKQAGVNYENDPKTLVF